MKKLLFFFIFMALSFPAFAANRYWVGGTASWDATAGSKWSTTSGGSGGSAVPTASDDVFFDGNSGAVTITISGARVCKSLDATGFTGTLAGTGGLSVGTSTAGNFTLVSGMTVTYTGTITFVSTTGTNNVTTGGKALRNLTFNGTGGTWQFQDNVNCGTSTIELTRGTLDTNGKTITAGQISSSNSNTRTLTLGASVLTLSSSSPWEFSTTTSLTLNANTSEIVLTSSFPIFNGGGKTYYKLTAGTAVTGTLQINGANTFTDFTRIGSSSSFSSLRFTANQTVSGVLTLTGDSFRRLHVFSNLYEQGGTRTLTINGSESVTNVDFEYITVAGTASPITGTSLGDCGGNTNITTDTPATQYWVGGSGNWSTAAEWASTSGGTGGTGRVPLPQDNVVFDANSFSTGSLSVSMNVARLGKTVNFTGVTNTPEISNDTGGVLYGSLTLVAGMTFTHNDSEIRFRGTSVTSTFTTAGHTIGALVVAIASGTLTLQDHLTLTQYFELDYGTFDANNKNITALYAFTSGIGATLNMGSGTWTITGSSNDNSFVWQVNAGDTLDAGTSTIVLANVDVGEDKTFDGQTKTYNNLTITGGDTGTVYIEDNADGTGNTFNVLTIGAPNTLVFNAGQTTTVSSFVATGSLGNEITIGSTDPGVTAFTLSDSAGDNNCDYLILQDSVATGGATWCAGANSTNVSGNTGWTFASCGGGTGVVKTINGTTYASVKTINGTAVASVKTFNGAATQ